MPWMRTCLPGCYGKPQTIFWTPKSVCEELFSINSRLLWCSFWFTVTRAYIPGGSSHLDAKVVLKSSAGHATHIKQPRTPTVVHTRGVVVGVCAKRLFP